VDVVGNPTPRLGPTEGVWKVDVDRLCAHVRRSERTPMSFQAGLH
jgi:hypothetical protein